MTLLGQDVLTEASRRNKPLRSWFAAWILAVENAEWGNIGDVRRTYPSADGLLLASGTVLTVFNVKGNEYRLLTWIDFEAAVVEALEVMTHSTYSKELWKGRY